MARFHDVETLSTLGSMWASKGHHQRSLPEKTNFHLIGGKEEIKDERIDTDGGECLLESGRRHGWKPKTMKAPVLLSFAAFSILIIVILEILAQRSRQAGGLSLVDDPKELSSAVTFAHLYLPVIVAVIYSLLWNWIDLDVKRIQPWLELSKPEGATGTDSIFSDYPVDFVGFAPLRAARQRHWLVFYSGSIMVLIFWIITPLQSSVLGTELVMVNRKASMMAPSQLMDSKAQAAVLDQSVLNAAYAITWLQQSYPSFTTADYALLPFRPVESQKNVANWTGVTTKYWTDLHCQPTTNITQSRPTLVTNVNINNGMNCTVSDLDLVWPGNPNFLYLGYPDSAWADLALQSPTCGPAAANQFLAVWSDVIDNKERNVSAQFCEAKYYKQKVSALIQANGEIPIDAQLKPLGPPEILPPNEFNGSAINHLLGTGVSPIDMQREFPFSDLLNQNSRASGRGFADPMSPMLGFALGGNNFTINDFADHILVSKLFQSVHRRIFSAAFSYVLINNTNSSHTEGEVHIVKYGVVVSRLFSALVEGFLGVVTVLILVLLWHCHREPSMLSEDPASLGSLFGLIQDSSILLRSFNGTGCLSEKKLREKLGDCIFQLVCGCQDISGKTTLRLIGGLNNDRALASEGAVGGRPAPEQMGHYSPIKPLALRKAVGISFLMLLCAAIGFLSYLRQEDQAIGGLSQPSSNLEINRLLTNYFPVIFATSVEPLWVVINRLLCLLQPFYDLLSDRGTARRTVKARYAALPPQLALWRAFKSGHILLGLICIITLLGNVLSVGLGAIFNNVPVQKTYQSTMSNRDISTLTYNQIARFNQNFITGNTSLTDIYYMVMATNLYGTHLPPWMTTEFSFLPVHLPLQSFPEGATYSATTTGFGLEPTCKSLGYYVAKEEQKPRLDPSLGDPHGNYTGCLRDWEPTAEWLSPDSYKNPNGTKCAEFIASFTASGVTNPDCRKSVIFGWSRAGPLEDKDRTINSSFIICTPVLRTAEFRISFDTLGNILDAHPLSDFQSTAPDANFTSNMVYNIGATNSIVTKSYVRWHETALSEDWFSYLLRLHTGNTDIYDPLAPTPDPISLIPLVESIYKQLFATAFNTAQKPLDDGHIEEMVGTYTVTEMRVFVSPLAFIVSVTILSLYVLMVVLFYGSGVTFFLPRMPTTIGSMLAYIAPSSLAHGMQSEKRVMDAAIFRFGRLIGPDGRAHIGIDVSEKVVPLDPVSLVKGETKKSKSLFGVELRLRRWREDEVLL